MIFWNQRYRRSPLWGQNIFPKRLVYPEHFSEEAWNEISYDSFEEIMDKMKYYPLDQAIKDLEKYHSFIDIDEV